MDKSNASGTLVCMMDSSPPRLATADPCCSYNCRTHLTATTMWRRAKTRGHRFRNMGRESTRLRSFCSSCRIAQPPHQWNASHTYKLHTAPHHVSRDFEGVLEWAMWTDAHVDVFKLACQRPRVLEIWAQYSRLLEISDHRLSSTRLFVCTPGPVILVESPAGYGYGNFSIISMSFWFIRLGLHDFRNVVYG